MSTEAMQVFFALLTVLAGAGSIAYVVLRLVSTRSEPARELGVAIADASVWIAFLVAAVATLGSLYFSEIAHFTPCRLCWFQRIAMYPLSAILLVGAIRRDPAVRWYASPLAVIGAGISAYHVLIEWRPALDTGACELTGPACSYVWFRELGFISLPTMALTGFLTILTLLVVRFPTRLSPQSPRTEHA